MKNPTVSNVADQIGAELVNRGVDNVPVITRESDEANTPALIRFEYGGESMAVELRQSDDGFELVDPDGEMGQTLDEYPTRDDIRRAVSDLLDS